MEALSGHEGSYIVQFIKRVVKNKNKRFVLTSRSTILNQGKILIDILRHQNTEKNEYEVTIDSLSGIDKAKILYSHMWHSALPAQYIEEMYKEKRYKKIISHKNYNPRIINFLTNAIRLEKCDPENYWRFILETLNNPAEVWENPFEAQQDDFSRSIVLLVTLNGRPLMQEELAEAYSRIVSLHQNSGFRGQRDFLINLRHLTGSLLSRKSSDGDAYYIDLFNPSIADYVLRRYSNDVPSLKAGFVCLRSVSSISTLASIHKNKFISQNAYREIIIEILRTGISQNFLDYLPEHIAEVALTIVNSLDLEQRYTSEIRKALMFIRHRNVSDYRISIAKFYLWALKENEITEDEAAKFVLDSCTYEIDETDLELLSRIASCLDKNSAFYNNVIEQLRDSIVVYISNNLSELVSGADAFESIDYDDYSAAKERISSFVLRFLENFPIEFSESDLESIINSFDTQAELENYYQNLHSDPIEHHDTKFAKSIDEIDDLFDRDNFPSY